MSRLGTCQSGACSQARDLYAADRIARVDYLAATCDLCSPRRPGLSGHGHDHTEQGDSPERKSDE